MNINETLLVTINLSDKAEESTVEVVTYLGPYRDVVNVFNGSDAELIYKTLMNANKKQLKEYMEKIAKRNAPEVILDPGFDDYMKKKNNPEVIKDLHFDDVSGIENLSERQIINPHLNVEGLKWEYANPELGKVTRTEVDGDTFYTLEKKEKDDDRDLEVAEV